MTGGDSVALAELYDCHGRTVYTLAVRIVGNGSDAEEVVQEVFAQAWTQASRYDAGRASVVGWLLMMTRARALDRLRARQARPDHWRATSFPEFPAADPGPDDVMVADEAAARVRVALGALEDALRRPLELAYYEGLTQSAIAERLEQPLGTVKTRMRVALSRLRAALQSESRL